MNESAETIYSFRPRLFGGEIACKLGGQSAEYIAGIRSSRFDYRAVDCVRLSFRPTNMSMKRYIMEIWPRGGSRIEIASVSFLPNFEVHDQAAQYRDFVRELHRRIASANSNCEFLGGFPLWRWWPLAAIGAICAVAGVGALGYALFTGQFLAVLVMGALGGFLLWQIGTMVVRNQPQKYRPDSIPENVLPKL